MQGSGQSLMLLSFMLGLCYSALGSNILLITAPVFSHCNKFGAIGESLQRLGHTVSAYVPHMFDARKCLIQRNISIIKYGEHSNESLNTFDIMSRAKLTSKTLILKEVRDAWCSSILHDHHSLKKLQDKQYDLAIVSSSFPARCYFLIPFRLKIPYVALNYWHIWFDSGKPFIPHMETPVFYYDGDITWYERMVNTVMRLIYPYVTPWPMRSESELSFAPELSYFDYIGLIRKSLLFIEDDDIIISGPQPVLPNTIHTGGFSVAPAKPLPDVMERFFMSAKSGVIVVTFGGARKNVPSKVFQIMKRISKHLTQHILMRNTKVIDSPNVLTKDWIPQNDALGHHKTRLFISHCGRNGAFEAIYHGVPLICFPSHMDQSLVANNLEARGMALKLNTDTVSEGQFKAAILTILNDTSYIKTAQRLSALYRSIHTDPPGDIAARAINHVLKYGGEHLRPASLDYSFLSFLLADIWIPVLGLLCSTVAAVLLCCRLVCFPTRGAKVKKE